MAFDSEWLELMPERISYRPASTRDKYGETGLGDPITNIPCRIVAKRRYIHTGAGDEREITTQITTGGFFDLKEDGVITMPDGSEVAIEAIETFPDEDGPHHQVLLL